MDLTRLYNLTTPELRHEAERLGVEDTYAMSRGQLIQAIRTKAGEPEPDGFLGKVFGFAKWALKAAGETKSGTVAAPEGETAAATASASEPVSVPVPVLTPAPPLPAPDEAEAELASEAEAEPDSQPEVEAESPTEVDSGPPSRPPAGVFSPSPGLFEEPFPTLTMARILAEQGHYKRALSIYARLLDEEPGDAQLGAEVEAVRAQARTRRSHAPN